MNLKSLTLFLCIYLFAGMCVAAPSSYAPKVGEAHEDFVLPRIDTGEPVTLSQFRGKKVLLINFASW